MAAKTIFTQMLDALNRRDMRAFDIYLLELHRRGQEAQDSGRITQEDIDRVRLYLDRKD